MNTPSFCTRRTPPRGGQSLTQILQLQQDGCSSDRSTILENVYLEYVADTSHLVIFENHRDILKQFESFLQSGFKDDVCVGLSGLFWLSAPIVRVPKLEQIQCPHLGRQLWSLWLRPTVLQNLRAPYFQFILRHHSLLQLLFLGETPLIKLRCRLHVSDRIGWVWQRRSLPDATRGFFFRWDE